MLRAEDNKFLTESGAGTGMGELLRRFGCRCCCRKNTRGRRPAEEDRRDGRGTARFPRLARRGRGHRSILSAPRRRSMARPQRGMRHPLRLYGWKFDTDGRCVDMPTSYPDLNAKDLMRIKSYPVREWADMIWAYMGPAGKVRLARSGDGAVPASRRYVARKWQDCNWVPALESSIDTAHFTFAILPSRRKRTKCYDVKRRFRQSDSRTMIDHMRWIAEDLAR